MRGMLKISRLLVFFSFFAVGQALAVAPIPPEIARLTKQTERLPLSPEIRASLESWPSNMVAAESLPPAVAALCSDSRGRLAAPGARWKATDYIRDSSLPQARLIWIVRSQNKMVIHYERGGIAHSYHLLSVDIEDDSKPVVLWRARSWNGLADFSSFLDAARHDKVFADEKG